MVEGYPYGLGGWGVPGIFKEGGRLMVKHWKLLAPFVFAFVLPTALVQLAEVLGISWYSGQSPFLPPGPHPHNHALHVYSKVSAGMDADAPLPPTPSGTALLVMLAVGILMWLLASLAVASIAKTVQYIYAEQDEDPAVIKSTFQSLPHALWRLLLTSIWIFLLTVATIFTVSLPFYIIAWLFNHKHAQLFNTLQQIFLSVSLTILGFLFLLSQEVAVLEPHNYGLEALKRSAKLVQEKFLASLIVFLVSIGVGALLSRLSTVAGAYPSKLPHWTIYIFAVLLAILYLVYMVYMLLVTIVLYFSSKLQYDAEDESLPEFRYRSGDNPYTPLVVVSY
ncbi:hypothetical protein KC19_8G178200 [Ceratodon purpureus]|uniref:Uncharacterized protein n=1 Tax=Ceratodon purpureus TaxID=3225 RepID=A0A8T0H047_CERPU|nr:hypothetical protein KC19_8G178200 [Ceratodon purpureus]KAG0565276.1 hypothetical protein KC19_8G178200 [Ceratodon purpureus]